MTKTATKAESRKPAPKPAPKPARKATPQPAVKSARKPAAPIASPEPAPAALAANALRMIKLTALQSNDAFDPRHDKDDKALAPLIASIKAKGLLYPLLVRSLGASVPSDHDIAKNETFEVIEGRRRLAALRKIYKANHLVPCIVVEQSDREARETAIAGNVVRLNLHPVAEFEAYASLVADGITAPEIAKRFGVKEKWVNQRLQLQRLAPSLRDAWRTDKMTEEQAEALSASSDHKRQEQVWKDARDPFSSAPRELRRRVLESSIAKDDARVTFVGLAAYEAAGGAFTEDLFADDRRLTDADVLRRLVTEKLKATIAKLKKDGWAWVEIASEHLHHYQCVRLDRAEIETADERAALDDDATPYKTRAAIEAAIARRAEESATMRAKSGVLIELASSGAPLIYTLLLRPGEAGAAKENDGGDDDWSPAAESASESAEPLDAEKPRISFAMREALGVALTTAVASRLKEEPAIAMAALIASIWVSRYTWGPSPVRVRTTKVDGAHDDKGKQDWPAYFSALLAMPDRLAGMTAPMIADLLDLGDKKIDDRDQWKKTRGAIVEALGMALGDQLRPAIVAVFDVEGYFTGVTIAECKAALSELGFVGTMPAGKAAIAALCARLAREKAWLPIELRIVNDGGQS